MIHFNNINFDHIYKDQNQLVDQLSKAALEGEEGVLFWEESHDNVVINSHNLNILAVYLAEFCGLFLQAESRFFQLD